MAPLSLIALAFGLASASLAAQELTEPILNSNGAAIQQAPSITPSMLPKQATASNWTRNDTWAEATYLTLHVADWLQTLQIVDPKNHVLYETNAVIGRKPPRGRANRYFLITGVAHILTARVLPPSARGWFQGITIGIEAGCIANNYSLGVKVML